MATLRLIRPRSLRTILRRSQRPWPPQQALARGAAVPPAWLLPSRSSVAAVELAAEWRPVDRGHSVLPVPPTAPPSRLRRRAPLEAALSRAPSSTTPSSASSRLSWGKIPRSTRWALKRRRTRPSRRADPPPPRSPSPPRRPRPRRRRQQQPRGRRRRSLRPRPPRLTARAGQASCLRLCLTPRRHRLHRRVNPRLRRLLPPPRPRRRRWHSRGSPRRPPCPATRG